MIEGHKARVACQGERAGRASEASSPSIDRRRRFPTAAADRREFVASFFPVPLWLL